MTPETQPFLLEVPVLEDATVDALHTFLLDLLMQFENHYGHQLRRHWLELNAETRDPLEPWKHITPSSLEPGKELNDDLNNEIPF
jgi:hypothetical protein